MNSAKEFSERPEERKGPEITNIRPLIGSVVIHGSVTVISVSSVEEAMKAMRRDHAVCAESHIHRSDK